MNEAQQYGGWIVWQILGRYFTFSAHFFSTLSVLFYPLLRGSTVHCDVIRHWMKQILHRFCLQTFTWYYHANRRPMRRQKFIVCFIKCSIYHPVSTIKKTPFNQNFPFLIFCFSIGWHPTEPLKVEQCVVLVNNFFGGIKGVPHACGSVHLISHKRLSLLSDF